MRPTAQFSTFGLTVLFASLLLTSAAHTQTGAVRGDVDGDGRVTSADARAVMDYVAGRAVPAGRRLLPNGDADGNGRITAVDAAIINAFAAGRDMSRYPVGRAIDAAQSSQLAALECQASVTDRAVSCRPSGSGTARGAMGDVLVGGQNLYVTLANGPVSIVADSFMFDVTVKNLVPQPMGLDSLGAVDPNGVRVIFASGPNATGVGIAEVANEDGTGTFTASNQPYFAYTGGLIGGDGMLAQGETSGARTWKIRFDPGVTGFTFVVYVSAPFEYPQGWIDLYPRADSIGPERVPTDTLLIGDTQQLVDSVRNAVGKVLTGQTTTWNATGPAILVSGAGLVTANAEGADSIVATSGVRKGRYFYRVTTVHADSSTITPTDATRTAGDSTLVTLQVKDGFGRPYPNAASVGFSTSHGTLSAPQSAGGGAYTSYLKWDSTGVATVTGQVEGNPIGDSATVTFSAGSPNSLTKLSTDPQSATVNTAVASPPSVSVKDALGNPIMGATVRFRVLSGGGKVNTADSVDIATNSGGIATLTSWTMGTVAGTSNDSLVVTVVGTGVTPVNFVASATPGAPANLAKSAGDGQSAVVNTEVATDPAVTITDTYGNPVPGVTVTFSVTLGGGSVTGGTPATNASGVATVGSWKLGTATGANTLHAAAGALSADFSGTGTPDVPATITRTSTDPQNGTVGAAVGSAPAVHVVDQYGNPTPGITINFTVTGGGGSTTLASPVTNASGNAAIGSWTPGNTAPGPNTLQAAATPAGTSTPVTFTAYVPPTLLADSSQAMGNTTLSPPVSPNVLSNDAGLNGTALTITTTGALTTARSGTLTLNADGTFSYLPAAGITGRDSVQYTINDTHLSSTGYIKLRFVGRVWYVDNTFGGTTTGRDVSPYTSVAAAEAVAAVNDTILVRTGSGTTAGGTLKNGQLLRGQGHNAAFTTTLNGQSVTLLATGTAPNVGSLTLGSGNSIRGMRIFNASGGGLTGASIGTLSLGEISVGVTGGPALDLATGTVTGNGGSGAAVLDSLRSTNSTTTGLSLSSVAGTLTVNGGTASRISGPTGTAFSISGSNPTVTFPGTISKTNAVGIGISLTSMTGGTVTFSGPSVVLSTGASAGINMTSSSATVSFVDSIKVNTTSGTGLNATGGGTLTIVGTHNSINSSGGGTAVNVSGTTVGAGGLNFYRVDATGSSSNIGIVLANTGAGGFVVSGDGLSDTTNAVRGRTTARSGGGTLALGSGGTISSRTNNGVSLTSASGVVLRNMVIQNNGTASVDSTKAGIRGTSVSGLTLDNVRVAGHAFVNGVYLDGSSSNFAAYHSEFDSNATNAATDNKEVHNILTQNLTGNLTVLLSRLQTSRHAHVASRNTTGSQTVKVTRSTFGTSSIGYGVWVEENGNGGASAAVTVQNDTFNVGASGWAVSLTTNTATSTSMTSSITNNYFNDNFLGVAIAHGSSGTNSFDVSNNNIQFTDAVGININRLGSPTFSSFGLFQGTVTSNTIGTSGVANSGPKNGDGIDVKTNSNGGTIRVSIVNNTIRGYGTQGIMVIPRDATTGHTLHARIQGNNIAEGKPGLSLDGINVTLGALNSDNLQVCLDIGGATAAVQNTVTSAIRNGIRIRTSGAPTPANVALTMPSYDGTGMTYIANRNPNATGGVANVLFSNAGPSGTSSAGNCTTP